MHTFYIFDTSPHSERPENQRHRHASGSQTTSSVWHPMCRGLLAADWMDGSTSTGSSCSRRTQTHPHPHLRRALPAAVAAVRGAWVNARAGRRPGRAVLRRGRAVAARSIRRARRAVVGAVFRGWRRRARGGRARGSRRGLLIRRRVRRLRLERADDVLDSTVGLRGTLRDAQRARLLIIA